MKKIYINLYDLYITYNYIGKFQFYTLHCVGTLVITILNHLKCISLNFILFILT